MSFPTPMSPWFVVFRHEDGGAREYYVSEVEVPVIDPEATVLRPEQGFTRKKAEAMVFTNLVNAARVARIEVAEVLVLSSKDDLAAFNR
jgi:hypothetical protein